MKRERYEKYYDPKINGVDWNAVHKRYGLPVEGIKERSWGRLTDNR